MIDLSDAARGKPAPRRRHASRSAPSPYAARQAGGCGRHKAAAATWRHRRRPTALEALLIARSCGRACFPQFSTAARIASAPTRSKSLTQH